MLNKSIEDFYKPYDKQLLSTYMLCVLAILPPYYIVKKKLYQINLHHKSTVYLYCVVSRRLKGISTSLKKVRPKNYNILSIFIYNIPCKYLLHRFLPVTIWSLSLWNPDLLSWTLLNGSYNQLSEICKSLRLSCLIG